MGQLVNDGHLVDEHAADHRQQRRLGPFRVAPVGFGAMRLTGPGVFGPPPDRSAALALLRAAVDSGVNHVDTAEYYGPTVVNELIREALHPYPPDLVIVSKVGARRDRAGRVLVHDQPEQLRSGIQDNLRSLRVDQVPVVNLRLMRQTAPDALFEDQLAAMIAARDEGLVAAIGLSNITVAHLLHALRFTEVACIQNAYNLVDRSSQRVLDACTQRGIAFVPFAPLGSGVARRGSMLGPQVTRVAARLGCTAAQLALAWALSMSPNVLLIPGTASPAHLQENLAAATIDLDADARRELANV
jgi:pyridoxine 4-dehydrogenase